MNIAGRNGRDDYRLRERCWPRKKTAEVAVAKRRSRPGQCAGQVIAEEDEK
jgi:hypothetical protein